MKKYAMLMLAAMLTIGLSVSAQDGKKRQRGGDNNRPRQEMKMTAKERADFMSKQLELTADQTVKVQTLMEKHDAKRTEQIAKFREEREKSAANRDKNREEMRSLREKEIKEFQAELESVIGKEKAEKWNSLRQNRMGSKRGGKK